MEAPSVQGVRAEAEEVFVGAGGRRGRSIDVRGENSAVTAGELEALFCCGGSGAHGSAIIGAEASAGEGVAAEHVVGGVVGSVPDAEFGIVVEVGLLVGVDAVGAGCIAGFGDGDALPVTEGAAVRDGKLREYPPVVRFVVLSDGVAVVVDCAGMGGAQGLKEFVTGYGTIEQSAGALIKDSEGFIDPLDVLRGSDGSVGIGRRGVYGKVGKAIAEAFKVESRSDGAVAGGER